MNAYRGVKPAMRLAFAIIVQLRCARNTSVVDDPVTDIRPLIRTVVLPKKARLLLCGTCKAALEQPRSGHAEYVGIEH